jgi:hypothetical protein
MKRRPIELSDDAMEPKPEARFAYYRRCKVLRANGVQCKAPAMKGGGVCYSHLTSVEMARRHRAQRQAVLEKAARQMRDSGAKDFSAADVFTHAGAIQKALGVMMAAVIQQTIDLDAAGILAQDLDAAVRRLTAKSRAG